MSELINWSVIKHPLNWIIVISFVIVGMIATREMTRLFQTGRSALPASPLS